MIPKTIHYCWFGQGKKSKLMEKCVKSWKRFCPDYEIIEWNESNFDINYNEYTKYCYDNKKWAFLSDYVRLFVVHENGGLYFDTDVEVIKNFDELLDNEAFFGFEDSKHINTGIGFGSEQGHLVLQKMIEEYNCFICDEKQLVGCPILNTNALVNEGLLLNGKRQVVLGALVLPKDYFNPYEDQTGKLNKTTNTYSIHWYSKSWMSKQVILRSKLSKPIHRMFGTDCLEKLKQLGVKHD